MKTVRSNSAWLSGLMGVALTLSAVQVVEAQNTNMPNTLRYGTGYLDVPVASVLPHLAISGTFSGFDEPR